MTARKPLNLDALNRKPALHATRESWLEAGVAELTFVFEAVGFVLPPVRVSCSWPGGG